VKVALKDHMKMAITGENMVRKISSVPNIQGQKRIHKPYKNYTYLPVCVGISLTDLLL
jgi:hypothetical protein